MARYDLIGVGYTTTRREEPRFRDRIHAALGASRTVVNVGAGAGSYEPRVRIETLPIPRDSADWMLGSFWAHPERVLDAGARAATSGFARMPADVVERIVSEVRRDLEDGTWNRKYGDLRAQGEYDGGLRLVVSTPRA